MVLLGVGLPAALADDWTNWRGPHYNNTSTETDLPAEWSPKGGDGDNLLWKSKALAGRSTPIVMGGKLYTLVRDQPGTELEGEKVVCADAATGEILWEHVFNVYLSDVPDTRVGWSSVVGDPETGRVYAQGVAGYFCCLEGDDGAVVWERSLHEELGLLSTYGGRTNFPLIYNDTVITSAVVIGWGDTPQWGLLAKPAHRFMAFDKATGELRWLSGTRLIPDDTTYSTPVLTHLEGQDLLIFGSGDGAVWAMQAATGKTIWNAPISRRGLNVSPVISEDGTVYTGHSEENMVGSAMGAVVAIDATKQGDISDQDLEWKKYQVMVGKSSPLLIDGKLVVVDDRAKMFVFDAKTGEQLDRQALGRVSRATPLYADGKTYYISQAGRFYVLKLKEDGTLETVSRTSLRGEDADASPIVANGRIYVTTSEYVYCIGNEESITANSSKDSKDKKKTESTEGEIAQILISPYDTIAEPGESVFYTLHAFDAKGRPTEPPTSGVMWTLSGDGGALTVSELVEYRAPEDARHQTSLLTVKYKDLTATARIRIVPPLPWNFDFEDGAEDVPLTWVGGRVRYNLREEGGNHFIAKPTELPTRPGAPTTKLGTRSQMWMGPSDLKDYTVQADVLMKTGLGGESDADTPAPEFSESGASNTAIKLPSAGLINSRYLFTLFGPNEEARLYSWSTHDKRTQATAAMTFEPDVWYTMKLKVTPEPDEGHAHVYAKVWKRSEAEPQEWTLEIVDEAPNYEGSPGLFGDSKDAEFYVDNLSVTPND